ncbi:NADH dehydrogenase [ubiquinone] 1 beta subcomplex subunit 11, mitochondrial isoform X2 [Daktulosphaira vitifoliae]|uniref:NADH dehydrogenase [ubiquinone] 1 beta subcomplex subunit 11, mitochondrial isoform X2 n=1 Tax=Daktulosphaira vitifoliae TaxID=58002 RepID=UPI0021A9C4D1|nr:NADH dehydrogenase [ubiquinone] 1 beta subcomplex subunit 11, mitochondrial isoform X2 [Daktulosphaira vitifoliae]
MNLIRISRMTSQANRLIHRFISTSKKNQEICVTDAEISQQEPPKRNWQSYGFEKDDETADLNAMHSTAFFSVTLCLVGGAFIFAYMPDYNYKGWGEREAFLELRRREEQGLPLIDPNYIDPSLINLPSDEELGDTEIVI